MAGGTYFCSAPQLALNTACDALRGGGPDAMPSLRRLARRLHESALHSGWDDAASAAAALELATDPAEALSLADVLAARLRMVAAIGHAPATILMVEDDALTAAVHTALLEDDGHIVMVCGSLSAARELIRSRRVDLVLLDLVLPREDGRDFLAELRSDPSVHALPIVVLTSRHDVATHAECFALGADAYFVKPVHPEVLRSAVAALLDLATSRREEGRIDRLTGLPNRVAFTDALDRASAVSRQGNRPLSVAMVDLDHFKSINDAYGHACGDEVLRSCAQAMSGALRPSDVIARWGGEEFCVLLPDTDIAGGAIALEKALCAVRGLLIASPDGKRFGITFSAGVVRAETGANAADALEQADALLYEAKEGGRDRVLTAANAATIPHPLVIVADDDPEVRKLIAKILERQGFSVVLCEDGAQAVEAVRDNSAALAVLDVNMPNMDGFEATRALRALPLGARLPILLLTGSDDEADLVRGFALGASDYMTKPLRIGEMIARVRRLLNRR